MLGTLLTVLAMNTLLLSMGFQIILATLLIGNCDMKFRMFMAVFNQVHQFPVLKLIDTSCQIEFGNDKFRESYK